MPGLQIQTTALDPINEAGGMTHGLFAQLPLGDTLVLCLPIFLVGVSVGSFLNVCIARWPLALSVVSPRSRCPRCERPIASRENIPLVSWLMLRGKCAGCALPISVQYPLVELLVGLAWVAAYLAFGVSFEALRVALFATVLFGIAITDAKHYLIPDGFTVSGLIMVLLCATVNLFLGETSHFAPLWPAVLGACVGAERSLLTIVMGAFVGSVTFLLFVAPIAKVRARRRGEAFAFPEVPFGVFLAPAALLTLLWGDALIAWYLLRTFPS